MFYCCEGLEKVTLGKNIKKIDSSAFQGTALKELVIPEAVEVIHSDAFKDIPDGLELIFLGMNTHFVGEYLSFGGCYAKTVYCLPGSSAQKYFRRCKLKPLSEYLEKQKAKSENKKDDVK